MAELSQGSIRRASYEDAGRICMETGEPVLVQSDGNAELCVIPASLLREIALREVETKLEKAIESMRSGRGIPIEDVIARYKKKL